MHFKNLKLNFRKYFLMILIVLSESVSRHGPKNSFIYQFFGHRQWIEYTLLLNVFMNIMDHLRVLNGVKK